MLQQKAIVLSLVLLLLLGTVLTVGCESTPEFTPEELQNMLTESVDTMLAVETFTSAMTMAMSINMTSEEEGSGFFTINMTADGSIDTVEEEMQMLMEIVMNADFAGMEIGLEDMSMDVYQVDDWAYVHLNLAEVGDRWAKASAGAEIMETYGSGMITENFVLLDDPTEITFLREENVGETPCYVIRVTPSQDTWMEWLESQDMMPVEELGVGMSEEFMSDIMDGMSYVFWLDKNDGFIRKMSTAINADISRTMMEEDYEGTDSVYLEISMEITLDNFDEPITIELPEEAADAEEVSLEDLMLFQ